MTRLFLILGLTVFTLATAGGTKAEVLVRNQTSISSSEFLANQTELTTGPGEAGDYILFSCLTTLSENLQQMNDPIPDVWTEIDLGECAQSSPEDNYCIHGIWGGFTEITEPGDIICSWTEGTDVSAAGSFRFTGVAEDPIIEASCDTGFSDLPTAPSVFTEPGSQVVRVFSFGTSAFLADSLQTQNRAITEPKTTGSWSANAQAVFEFVISEGRTELYQRGGPTGKGEFEVQDPVAWRACTIALRMANLPRPIPTMSEWGFIAVAVFMGAAGVWYLRRKQQTA